MVIKNLSKTVGLVMGGISFIFPFAYAQEIENKDWNVQAMNGDQMQVLLAYFKAIEAGDLETVTKMYEVVGKNNPVEPGLLGRTALGVAAYAGKKNIVVFLVEKGGKSILDNPGTSRGSSLFWAVQRQHDDLVSYLLEQGASVDYGVKGHETILGLAAAQETTTILDKLLGAKPSPNLEIVNGSGETPLMVAAVAGRPESVKRLLAAGAKREAVRAKDQKNAFGMAQEAFMGLNPNMKNYTEWKNRLEAVGSLLHP